MRSRPASLALHGALLAVLVAGPMAYVSAGKTVRLTTDGVERDVRTYAGTVGEILRQQGITVGAHDFVVPPLAAGLTPGMQVVLLHGRRVHLVVDGVARTVWTTASTVAALADALGPAFRSAYLSASRYAPIPLRGMSLQVRLAKQVDVMYGGHPAVLVTTAQNWAQVMAQAGLPLGLHAILSVPPSSAPVAGQHVSVWLTGSKTVLRTVSIPFATVIESTSALFVGASRVVRAGRPGRWVQTWRYTVRDGRLMAARLMRRLLVANAVARLVEVGSRQHVVAPPSPGYPRTSVDVLDWSALAMCESGGNPRAVGGGGMYFGLYQFMLSTWQEMGGAGNPIDASATEQTFRAKLLYLRDGASAWPYCGQFL